MIGLRALTRGPVLETSHFYMGMLLSFLVHGNEANGRLAVVEVKGNAGSEPPPHVHHWEHELYYVLHGTMEFFVEGEVTHSTLQAGELIFLPQGKAHAFRSVSSDYRLLLIVVAGGSHSVSLDQYFREIAQPATRMELPEAAVTYAMSDPAGVARLAARHGIQIVPQEETRSRLPTYPGFGAQRTMLKSI